MIGEPQAQSDDAESRERPAAGWKDRAAGNIEVVDTMHPALAIDDAFMRVVRHSGGAQMMRSTTDLWHGAVALI